MAFETLRDIAAIRDKSAVPDEIDAVIGVVVDGWPDDVREFFTALTEHLPNAHIAVLDAGNVDGAGDLVEEIAAAHASNTWHIFHLPQTLAEIGWAAARMALIRTIPSRVHVVVDLSTVLDGDAITPLVTAIAGDVVAAGWRGVNVDLEDSWYSFKDAPQPGECDAVLSYLFAVSRAAALKTPAHRKAKFYRNADLEWSLALRAAGGKIVMPLADLPCHQARHRGYHDSDPEYRDAHSKDTYMRMLRAHKGNTDILAPRS